MGSSQLQKGEYAISVAVAGVMVLALLAIQQQWQAPDLKEAASSATEFILETTGIRGQIPEIPGYERIKTFRLGLYRAALYRASPAELIFAPGRFVVYNRDNHAVFMVETLEGSKDSWTEVYDFVGRLGLTPRGSRTRPTYTRSLTGNVEPEIVVGQYSGGDHCCTTVTIVELGKATVKVLGSIDGLDGLPFEGIELRKLDKDRPWEIIAHRPARVACGSHEDAADVLSVYAYADGKFIDQSPRYASFLEGVLRQNLGKWSQEKERSLQLMQTVAADYAALGRQDEAKQFVEANLKRFLSELQKKGVDPDDCLKDAENFVAGLPGVQP